MLSNTPSKFRPSSDDFRHKGPLSHQQAMESLAMRRKMDYALLVHDRTDIMSEDRDAVEDALIAALDAKREEERELREYGLPDMSHTATAETSNASTDEDESDDEAPRSGRRERKLPFDKTRRTRREMKRAA